AILRIPQDPHGLHNRIRLVVDDDVILAVDHLRLIDRQARILTDLNFPVFIESAQIAVTVAFRERLAMLDYRLLDLFGEVTRDDTGGRRRKAEILENRDDLRVEILQLPERGVNGEHDTFALVGCQRRATWRAGHGYPGIGASPSA